MNVAEVEHVERAEEPEARGGGREATGAHRRTHEEGAAHEVQLAALEAPVVRLGELARAVARHVRARPTASLLAAVGAGFVVGGALSFRAGRVALAVALRRVAREVLKQLL